MIWNRIASNIAAGKVFSVVHRATMVVEKCPRNPSLTSFRRLSIYTFFAFVVLLVAFFSVFATKNTVEHDFYSRFVEYADKIAENFNDQIHTNLLALDSLSISSTSYALNTNNSWPTITIPDFAIRSWTTRQEMRATTLGILPVVTADKREIWEKYVEENHSWIDEAHEWESKKRENHGPSYRLLHAEISESTNGHGISSRRNLARKANFSDGISSNIYTLNMEGMAVVDEGIGPFLPIWMTSPAPKDSMIVNFNMLSHHLFWKAIEDCMYSRLAVLSRVINYESNGNRQIIGDSSAQVLEEPISSIIYPIFDTFDDESNIVAVLAAEINWSVLLESSLQDSAIEVICVVETACDQKFSFKIDEFKTTFLGSGDYHDPKFSNLLQTRGPKELIEKIEGFNGTPLDLSHCPFLIHLYPTSAMKEIHTSFGFILVVSSLFVLLIFTVLLFLYLDNHCTRIKTEIAKSNSFEAKSKYVEKEAVSGKIIMNVPRLWKQRSSRSSTLPKHLKDVVRTIPEGTVRTSDTEPNIVTSATVMIAGICSLKEWGERREEQETTDLLETILQSLNVIAKRHGISQVEMIDDNFLAIIGSVNRDIDHAAIAVYFACECRKRISEIFKSISAKTLSIRFGIHSGNLKPEISSLGNRTCRFEIIGDTVDIAYQMLEDGKPNRIQVSVDTAELLNLAGRSHWIFPRSDSVSVKGIGNMATFWVKPKSCISTVAVNKGLFHEEKDGKFTNSSVYKDNDFGNFRGINDCSEKDFESLVDQNTAILLRYLRAIYAKRLVIKQKRQTFIPSPWDGDIQIGASILEEAREIIQPASFDLRISMNPVDPSLIEISQKVQSQLRIYVASIGATYRRTNSFHNFQHASFTVLSIDQMIKKITSAHGILQTGFDGIPRTPVDIAKELDARTFSIDSDPIIQFAMVFSALVYGVDHMGIPNRQLIKNGSPLASLYKKRCIIQQNSVDISWWLLMKEDYDHLRSAIYSDSSEKRRFRQVLVNSVIATDTTDAMMIKNRDNNWNKAFVNKVKLKHRNCMDPTEKRSLQVTLIIEFIMQVAISSYRMQSYRTYAKWNERLFEEDFKSYHAGNLEVNPATSWYESELHHFQNYLIPLLLRLKDVDIFGDSGESFLVQASDNFNAWKSGGENMVKDMVDRFSRKIVAGQEDTIHFS